MVDKKKLDLQNAPLTDLLEAVTILCRSYCARVRMPCAGATAEGIAELQVLLNPAHIRVLAVSLTPREKARARAEGIPWTDVLVFEPATEPGTVGIEAVMP